MKIGFCFLVVNKIHNINVWEKWFSYFDVDFEIVIHSKNKDNSYPVNSIFKNKILNDIGETKNSFKTLRGQFKLWKKSITKKCDYSILLSESCLPLHMPHVLIKMLRRNKKKSIFNYNTPWMKPINKQATLANTQWVILYKDHIELLLENENYIDIVEKLHQPDNELFVANVFNKERILNNKHLCKRNLTYAKFEKKKSHPITHSKLNYKLIVTCSKKHIFHRKYSDLKINELEYIKTIQNNKFLYE